MGQRRRIAMQKILRDKKGITLFELAVVLAGLALMSTVSIPYFIRQAEIAAANKTAKEISNIQEASKWYYVNNKAWPSSVESLKNNGFLNSSWTSANPWGNSYAISTNATSLTVTTLVPNSVGGFLTRALPGTSSFLSGSLRGVNSTIPVPGQEGSLTSVTNLANSALNAATNAQSTASNAQTTANSAQSTANTALNTANSAMSLAQSSALPPCCPITVPHAGGQGVGTTCPNGYVMIGTVNEFSRAQIPRDLICGKVAR